MKPVSGKKTWIWPRLLLGALLLKSGVTHAADTTSNTVAAPVFNAADYPSHWQFRRLHEPVFGGELLVIESGRHDAPTVLLVHGLGQNGFRDWLKQIDVLAAQFHVVALDLPGFGFSDAPPGRYSPTQYAKVLSWLSTALGYGKSHVVGHSMGAAVSLRFAAANPDLVDRLVLIDAAGILERTTFLKSSAELPLGLPHLPTPLRKLAVQVTDFSDSLVEVSGFGPDPTSFLHHHDAAWNLFFKDSPNTNAAVALIEENFTQAVYTLPQSTTLIWGENDRIAPLRTGQMLASRLPAATLHIIPGAAHVPMTTHADVVNQLLLNALSKPWNKSLPAVTQTAAVENLVCKNQTGNTYRGHFRSIEIDHCIGVQLEDVTADNITLNESIVSFHNLHIDGKGVAFSSRESVVKITSASITGDTSIHSEGSRLDLAGVTLTGRKIALHSGKKSRVILSISDINSPRYTGFAHGAYKVANGRLEDLLAY